MLIAAAVRAPTSVAIALFTLAVSAASFVNSPVVRLVSGSRFDAQPLRAAAPIAARATLSTLRLVGFIGFPFPGRFMVARLHRVKRPFRRLGLLFHLD
jgi:hypothetical protein